MKHIKPLYAPDHDRLWAVCEDLGVIVNTHSGGAGMPDYGPYPAAGLLWIAETSFFSRRPLTQMIVGGVFERFPDTALRTDGTGCLLDRAHPRAARFVPRPDEGRSGASANSSTTRTEVLPLKPSEYFARNCWVGVSFPSPMEAAARDDIGVDRFMWGSDYPHDESTYPNTREALRRAFAGAPEGELRQVLGGNAAGLYDFDLARLRPSPIGVGPTYEELSVPYQGGVPEGNRSPAFVRS